MSRAFVKEPDGDDVREELPERQHSDAPNYITPRGEQQLRTRVHELDESRAVLATEPDRLGKSGELQRLESDLRYLQERLKRAIVVQTPEPPFETVGVGARIELVDEDDETHRFEIVGEDEVDVAAGRVSWNSPLGHAVLRREVGNAVIWKRPAGDLEVEIVSIDYPECAE